MREKLNLDREREGLKGEGKRKIIAINNWNGTRIRTERGRGTDIEKGGVELSCLTPD